jgi:asparagine synthase (glutamine-hydrolysing)
MTGALVHRGPDSMGHWVDEQAGVSLGHRRLAIIDLSPEGHQPMVSACERYVIVFNGEIYNYKSLRRELEEQADGAPPLHFRGHSDTEVMLACISRWGLMQALQRFNGMFAFALWDRREHRLHLARDRMGEKPLYYGWTGKSFVFGSELKSLRAHPDFKGEINRDALALYLRHNYIPSPYSIFRGIYKLPPGTLITVDGSGGNKVPSPHAYWSCREAAEKGVADPFHGSEHEAIEQLESLLRDAVKLRMEADVPLGAFLSGGVDSSTVVALMQAQSERKVRTFSIGFHEAGYNEAVYAKAVAQHLGTDHTELYVSTEEAMAVIPRLSTLYDEPFADPSQIPTYLVSALARGHVTVSLSGDGGDELFAGYSRYFRTRRAWSRIHGMPKGLRSATAAMLKIIPSSAWGGVFSLLRPVLPRKIAQRLHGNKPHELAEIMSSESPEALYLWTMSHWKRPGDLVPGSHELPTVMSDSGQWPSFTDPMERMMYFDTMMYMPDDVLAKMDRASMGVSLEGRIPLLDHRLVELAWRIPLAMKVREGQGKWLLRQVLYKYVPKELIERPKMGFGVPVGAWLRGGLREWAEDLLDEQRLRREGFFDPAPIREKWSEHIAGKRNWQFHLWVILMFQTWLETQ